MGTRVNYKVAAGGNFLRDGIFLNLDCGGGGYTTVCISQDSKNCISKRVNFIVYKKVNLRIGKRTAQHLHF